MSKCTRCGRGDCCGGDFEALQAQNKGMQESIDTIGPKYVALQAKVEKQKKHMEFME